MVCGLPGYYPDDLIDVVLSDDGGTVSIAFDAGIERPVRLTADEAFALTVALRSLAELPGLVDTEAVHSALAEARARRSAGRRRTCGSRRPTRRPRWARSGRPWPRQRRLWMRYYTASRDAVTERTVDPLRADRHRRARVPRGLLPPRRRRSGTSGWTESTRRACSTSRRSRRCGSTRTFPERIFHPDPQIPPVTLRLAPSGALGRRVLPDGGGRRPRRRIRRIAGADARRSRRLDGPARALARRRRGPGGPARAGRRRSPAAPRRRSPPIANDPGCVPLICPRPANARPR